MSFTLQNILQRDPGEPKVTEIYEFSDVLGKGAFGVVRRVKSKETNEEAACKTIAKAKLVCKEDVEDVKNEIAILNHLGGHENIVSFKSCHEDSRHIHIVMELCKGGELFDNIVEAGSYTEKKAAELFRIMVDVIRHCHDLGVMHRDLKPENFLLSGKAPKECQLKLTDFGLSHFYKPGDKFRDLIGSPYYVAPEVLKRFYGHEADMWSLGVILYIMLSGLPPFWGDTEEQIFKMVVRGNLDFVSSPWPKISDAAKDCIRRLCELDVSKRATAKDILQHPWLIMEGVAPNEPIEGAVLHRIKTFAAMNKMKKAAMLVIGQNLSKEEIKGMKIMFKNIDKDGSGSISASELKEALQQWGEKISQEEVQKIMDIADVDGDGSIDYNEFVAATMSLAKLNQEELLRKAFSDFDSNGDGHISESELVSVLEKFNISENVQDLIKMVDKNNDGNIDYDEFRIMMRSNLNSVESDGGLMENAKRALRNL